MRSKRPGRRKAGSRCQGALVAPSTSTPSLDFWTPSSSARNCAITWRWWPACISLRRAASASTSSKNSTHGLRRRASSNSACTFSAVADPHVEHVVDADAQKSGVAFAGRRARQQRLATTRRSEHQDAAADGLAVGLEELGCSRGWMILMPISCLTASMPPTSANERWTLESAREAALLRRAVALAVRECLDLVGVLVVVGRSGCSPLVRDAPLEVRIGQRRIGIERRAVAGACVGEIVGALRDARCQEVRRGVEPAAQLSSCPGSPWTAEFLPVSSTARARA